MKEKDCNTCIFRKSEVQMEGLAITGIIDRCDLGFELYSATICDAQKEDLLKKEMFGLKKGTS